MHFLSKKKTTCQEINKYLTYSQEWNLEFLSSSHAPQSAFFLDCPHGLVHICQESFLMRSSLVYSGKKTHDLVYIWSGSIDTASLQMSLSSTWSLVDLLFNQELVLNVLYIVESLLSVFVMQNSTQKYCRT